MPVTGTLSTMAELVAPVSLCTARGLLNPEAVGWSREPLHNANLRGQVHSRRWEHWAVVTPRFFVGLTIATAGYGGNHRISVLDRRSGAETAHWIREPFARTAQLPDRAAAGISRVQARGVMLEFAVTPTRARLRASAPGLQFSADVVGQVGDESLGVVVPWSPRRFHYTFKDVGRAATGTLVLGGQRHGFGADGTFAVRDHGRGRHPHVSTWDWAVGAGRVAGRRLALQLGGRWTDGTGARENALFVEGRLHRIDEDLEWHYDRTDWMAPWRIRGHRVGVTFAPAHERRWRPGPWAPGGEVHQCFGVFTGWVVNDSRRRLRVDGLVGWAQEARRRVAGSSGGPVVRRSTGHGTTLSQ